MKFLWIVVFLALTSYANSYTSSNSFPRLNHNQFQLKGALCTHRRENKNSRLYLKMESNQVATSKGGLKNLPRVFPAPELWARALKRSTYVKEDVSIQNARIRCRKLAAERLSVLSKELTKPLGSFLDGYGSVLSRLPPFEKIVVDLTVRHRYSVAWFSCHIWILNSFRGLGNWQVMDPCEKL
jgi:hypothetical protein